MGKTYNAKQELKSFLQDLGLPKCSESAWVHRMIKSRIPVGPISIALQMKAVSYQLVEIQKSIDSLHGSTVPIDRCGTWVKFWRRPRYLWKTLFRAGCIERHDDETEEDMWRWEMAKLTHVAAKHADQLHPSTPNSPPKLSKEQEAALLQKFIERQDETRKDQIAAIRGGFEDLRNWNAMKESGDLGELEFFDAARFLFQVWFPSLIEFGKSP